MSSKMYFVWLDGSGTIVEMCDKDIDALQGLEDYFYPMVGPFRTKRAAVRFVNKYKRLQKILDKSIAHMYNIIKNKRGENGKHNKQMD